MSQVPLDCPPGNAAFDPFLILTLGAAVVNRNANHDVSRLARAVNNQKIHDVSNVKQNDTGASGEIGLRFFLPQIARDRGAFPGQGGIFFFANFERTEIDGSSTGASGPHNITVFSGLGVQGTFNNSIPGGYSVLNQPNSFNYVHEFLQNRFQAGGGFEIRQGRFVFTPSIGGRFQRTSVEDNFVANVPLFNFPIEGQYITQTDINSFGGFIGLDAEYRAPDSPFIIFFNSRMGFDSNRGKSDILFRFTTPAFEDIQRITISDNRVTPHFRVAGGLGTNIGPVQARISGFADYGGGAAQIFIPGDGAIPQLDIGNATNYGLKGEMVMRMGYGLSSREEQTFSGVPTR